MKKLVIISKGINTGNRVLNQINNLFKNHLKMENILVSELEDKLIDADLILFTADYIKERTINLIDSKIPYIVANRIIDHKNIGDIISIEEGKDVLLINDGYDTAKEAMEQLLELGLNHIQYHLYYPDCTSYPQLKIAITPGERELSPYKPEKLIDLGTRILDIPTIHEIADMLDLEKHLKDSLITEYLRDIVEISKKIEEARRKSLETQQVLATIINSLDYGIAFLNIDGLITDLNPKFEYIFGKKRKDLINRKITDLIPHETFEIKGGNTKTIRIGNHEVHVELREIRLSPKIGYILSLKYDVKCLQRTNYKDKTPVKRNLYNFGDYYTINKRALDVISKAKKFSTTDATILIQGENGTGKEILAQGIHANSYRNKRVFIPINMATISSSLVESELFGYEAGTFTGALKEGRIGLFEMAEGGTVFIDEIGDTPLDVQAKLLRTLEEKRIRRIGADEEIPIDVRIIAASNKNLLKLVEEEKFRLDLFFRLNILPLQTIPLRHRKEDIEYLLMHFINIGLKNYQIKSLDEFFLKSTLDFLNTYKWIGNVRELINLVEYLILIYTGEPFAIEALHSYMVENDKNEYRVFLNEDEVWVLGQFMKHESSSLGRTKLSEFAKKENKNIGEGRIRTILNELKEKDLIVSCGKSGCTINEKGRKYLSDL